MSTRRAIVAGVVTAAAVSLVLCSATLSALGARATDKAWSVDTADTEFTTVPVGAYSFKYLHHVGHNRNVWQLSVWMPHTKAPAGIAQATITRSYDVHEQGEGDSVRVTYFGERSQADASPPAKLAVYLHCLIEDASGTVESKDWVRIGITTVDTSGSETTYDIRSITGKGCQEKVGLGGARVIDGARLELRGADEKRDHQHRTINLITFALYNAPPNGVVDDFTHETTGKSS